MMAMTTSSSIRVKALDCGIRGGQMEARVLTLSSGSWAGVILRGGCERNKGYETKVSVEALRAKSEQTGSSPHRSGQRIKEHRGSV